MLVNQMHSDIFKSFVMNNPDLVYLMKSSEHGINLHKPNPYHMEGDVWTHTCLVYQVLLYIPQFFELSTNLQKMACLAALCHDLGKPYKRFVNEFNRPRFGGHEQRSVVEMMNLTDYLFNEIGFDSDDIYHLMLIVSAHSVYWLGKSMQEVVPCLNYNSDLLDVYKVLAMADQMGQIREDVSDGKKDIYDFDFDLTDDFGIPVNESKIVYITIGAPGSGKDYMLKNRVPGIKIVSYDAIRVDLYTQANGAASDVPSSELYQTARIWNQKRKIDLDKYIFSQMRELYLAGDVIGVSNTNMTRKGRISFVKKVQSVCPDYSIVYLLVFAPVENLIQRDIDRYSTDKTVGSMAIQQILNNFEVPTLSEGVDAIIPCYNGI